MYLFLQIAEHKDKVQEHEKLLFGVINKLIQMTRDAHNKTTSIDSLKCLAQIGPLKISTVSYYFQNDFEAFEKVGY